MNTLGMHSTFIKLLKDDFKRYTNVKVEKNATKKVSLLTCDTNRIMYTWIT